jgi:glycosyltransferase involved in cell wall biosynthesis
MSDITAVINLHAEGALAQAAFRSTARAKAFAESRGLSVEVLAVLDRPDAATLEFAKQCDLVEFTALQVDLGDIGSARNAGAAAARGEWLSFLDGDNLWAENWLVAAHAAAVKDSRSIVWRPQVRLGFGTHSDLFICVDMEDADYDLLNLSMANHWPQLCFARRSLFLEIPYPKTDLARHIGYEDWAWNIETVARGCIHKIVPDTVYARRAKAAGSLLQRTDQRKALPPPTRLFRDMISNDGPVRAS